jgi:hypothetical protein
VVGGHEGLHYLAVVKRKLRDARVQLLERQHAHRLGVVAGARPLADGPPDEYLRRRVAARVAPRIREEAPLLHALQRQSSLLECLASHGLLGRLAHLDEAARHRQAAAILADDKDERMRFASGFVGELDYDVGGEGRRAHAVAARSAEAGAGRSRVHKVALAERVESQVVAREAEGVDEG